MTKADKKMIQKKSAKVSHKIGFPQLKKKQQTYPIPHTDTTTLW